MSRRKTFCEKYPELCERDNFTTYRPTKYVGTQDVPQRPRRVPLLEKDVVQRPRRVPLLEKDVPLLEKDVPQRPRRNFTEPNYRPRRNITPNVEPPPIVDRDNLGLPVKRKPPEAPDTPPPPDALLQAIKKGDEKLKELKGKALSQVGLGNETVIEPMRQHKYARLSDVAYQYGYGNTEKANEIIRNGDYIPDFVDFEILPELSTKDRTVLKNKTTGEVVMATRGSDTKFADPKTLYKDPSRIKNVEDWVVNAHTLMGNPEKTQRYQETTKAVPEVAKTLGVEPNEIHFTGHSNGGGNARRQSEIFGAKATTFNASDNPFKDMTNPGGAKEGTEVKAFRTYGDIVSSGHESFTPEHMDVERLTATPGTEADLIEQHGLDQFYHDNPNINSAGEIENVRTGKAKNFIGTAGGAVASGMLGIIGAEALAPIYDDSRVQEKEQGFIVADTGKGLLPELDPGGTLVDAIQTMGMGLQPNEVKSIRKFLGLHNETREEARDRKAKVQDPALITWLQKRTGRYEQDRISEDQEEVYYGTKSGRGVKIDPKTGRIREVTQEEQDERNARSQQYADRHSFYQGAHQQVTRKQSPYGVNPYPIGSDEHREYQRQSLAWDENQRKVEVREDKWNTYWEAHPEQKVLFDAEQEASSKAQRIDTRPRPTFKGKPRGGAFLGTYDSRPLSEQQSLPEILNMPEPEP